jgi:hypothetical protein
MIVLDTKDFNKTLQRYMELSGRFYVDETNRRAANICLRAMAKTKGADIEAISKSLKADESYEATYISVSKKGKETERVRRGKPSIFYMGRKEALKIATWRIRRGKNKGFYQSFPRSLAGPGRGNKGRSGSASVFYNKLVKTSRSASGYIAAGWIPAYNFFKSLGVKGPEPKEVIKASKSLMKRFSALKGSAHFGGGVAATIGKCRAIFGNSADGADNPKSGAWRGLQMAIDDEEADMKVHIERENQKIADKLKR